MNNFLEEDFNQLDILFEKVKKQSLEYIQNSDQRSTTTHVDPHPENASYTIEEGIGTLEALQLFNTRFEPLMVSSIGPRYWGFVTGGTTPASVVGDWLTSVYDQNPQTIKGDGDISAVIEIETIQLLLDLFELPKDFFGGFVTGATMSNFTSLAVARQWLGKQEGKDYAKEGISGTNYVLSAVPHSSSVKSLALLGLGSNTVKTVKTLPGNREAIDIPDLEEQIKKLEGKPFILISSGGTVNTVDFDDFSAILELKKKYNFWWHIDAAFGGFAACSDAYKHLLKGWEHADSITIDCHKWLNVPYENAVFFIKEKHRFLQVETFQNSNAPYLGDPFEQFGYLNFLPENSRRLRALPVWFTLVAYGKQGYKEIVENDIILAKKMGEMIELSDDFELLAPVRLNTVCFTLKGKENQDKVDAFLSALNNTGKVFMTPTLYKGDKGIRAALVNSRTTEKDIHLVVKLMNEISKDLK